MVAPPSPPINSRSLALPFTKSPDAPVASTVSAPDPPTIMSLPDDTTRSDPLPNRIELLPPPAVTLSLPLPAAMMRLLPAAVFKDQLPAPPTSSLLLPPPATTVPEPLAATNVRLVAWSDKIVGSDAPESNTTAEPGTFTMSVV